MRRERYVFNKQTLRYEKVVEPLSTTILRVFGFLCAAVLTAVVFTIFMHEYFPSPKERELQATNERLQTYINNEMQSSIVQLNAVALHLQKRDAYVHRMVFGMEPIDDNIWNGGVGGHDAYSEFESYGESGEMMAEMETKIDRLKHQLSLQSQSLDTILNMAKEKEKLLASMPTIKPIRADLLRKDLSLLSGFGPRLHPVHKVMRMHNGIDFSARTGTPIQATGDGKVVRATRASGYGNLVVVDHGFGYKTYYAHMSKITVRKGQTVKRGENIGLVGSTGTSTAPHCHYEVHYQGKPVDPINFVMDGLTPEEYKALTTVAAEVNQSLHAH